MTTKISIGMSSPMLILQIIFLALKLSQTIDWLWPVVLLPIEISMGVMAFIFLILFLVLIAREHSRYR